MVLQEQTANMQNYDVLSEPLVNRFATRRKSVFAETYDPENDADEDEGAAAILPKSDEQRARLIESVRNILLFRSLDKEQMNQVLDAMFERKVSGGEIVIRQGDDGDNFYVIESGKYKALVGDKHIHTYNNSGSFGELALLYNMPRAATIEAETTGHLWAMDRQTFRRILLKSAFRKRKMYESLLDSVPMLKTLQNYERMNLADELVPKSFSKGDRIIKQGDAADGMYFIEDGTVSIRIEQEAGEVEISTLGKGSYFGELALVTHRPRAASAYAATDIKAACNIKLSEPLVNRFATRRKSVFAETYDPENDAEEDEGAAAILPKSDEQRARLIESVRNILLFRSLDKEQMNQVLDAMFERKVSGGEIVIRQGDDGDNFYVIESGKYKALVGDKHIHTYNNSGSFGELALLYNMPRAATIEAETTGHLWAMDRQTFRRILLKSAFRKRKMYESLLDSVPMLKTLQNYERMNLADELVPKSFSKGDRIIKQGDAADGMYFIEDGTVSIRIEQEAGEVEISTLGKGSYFGELALVTHRPRAASAYAATDIKAAFLDVDAFERLLGPCMDLMKRSIGDYETQLIKIFGSKNNITDIR